MHHPPPLPSTHKLTRPHCEHTPPRMHAWIHPNTHPLLPTPPLPTPQRTLEEPDIEPDVARVLLLLAEELGLTVPLELVTLAPLQEPGRGRGGEKESGVVVVVTMRQRTSSMVTSGRKMRIGVVHREEGHGG